MRWADTRPGRYETLRVGLWFGRLRITRRATYYAWDAECECGVKVQRLSYELYNGVSLMCQDCWKKVKAHLETLTKRRRLKHYLCQSTWDNKPKLRSRPCNTDSQELDTECDSDSQELDME